MKKAVAYLVLVGLLVLGYKYLDSCEMIYPFPYKCSFGKE